jgi:hypothetical protein
MKSFVIFALLCFENPQSEVGITCMNFWEDPIKHYKNERTCLQASAKRGNEVEIKFEQENIEIKEFILWCMPVTKKVDL